MDIIAEEIRQEGRRRIQIAIMRIILCLLIYFLLRDIIFIFIYKLSFGTLVYANYLSFFLRERLPYMLGSLIIILYSLRVIGGNLSNKISEMKALGGLEKAKDSLSNNEIKKIESQIFKIRIEIVGLYFVVILSSEVIHTLINSSFKENLGTEFFSFDIQYYLISIILLLISAILTYLWSNDLLNRSREVMNIYLMGNRRLNSRALFLIFITTLSLILFALISHYYLSIDKLLNKRILAKIEQVSQAGDDSLNLFLKEIPVILAEDSRRLSHFEYISHSSQINISSFINTNDKLIQKSSDYAVMLLSVLFLLFIILSIYSHQYLLTLNRISNKLNGLIKYGRSLNKPMIITEFNETGYLIGYLNLLAAFIAKNLGVIQNKVSKLNSIFTTSFAVMSEGLKHNTALSYTFSKVSFRGRQQDRLLRDVAINLNDLKNIIQKIEEATVLQSRFLQEARRTVENFLKTIDKVDLYTEQANKTIKALIDSSSNGAKIVQSSFATMTDIARATFKIKDIISLIDRISSQTGLLSMNASIESAHAGRHGHGFSVVASSIRNLSDNADVQNKAIRNQVKDMSVKVDQGLGLTKNSSATLEDIKSLANESQMLVQEVIETIHEQRRESASILKKIGQLESSSQTILKDLEIQAESIIQIEANLTELQSKTANIISSASGQLERNNEVINLLNSLILHLDNNVINLRSIEQDAAKIKL